MSKLSEHYRKSCSVVPPMDVVVIKSTHADLLIKEAHHSADPKKIEELSDAVRESMFSPIMARDVIYLCDCIEGVVNAHVPGSVESELDDLG